MGTNFYWHERAKCEHCGSESEPKHIGKSSHGWCFSLHVYPEDCIFDLPDWERVWAEGEKHGGYVRDEHGRFVLLSEMRSWITKRQGRAPVDWDAETLRRNHAELGPNNLIRYRIDSRCVSHGATWDCIDGEFS